MRRHLKAPNAPADSTKVIFSLTAAQLAALRAPGADLFPHARRDPRWTLVQKGLLCDDRANNYGDRFKATPFGRAVLDGLKEIKL